MQILEGIFSLVVLMSFTMLMMAGADYKTDYTLYQYQLANDVWRVAYLRHGDPFLLTPSVAAEDFEEISEKTALCIEGDSYTTCNVEEGITIKKHTLLGKETLKVGR